MSKYKAKTFPVMVGIDAGIKTGIAIYSRGRWELKTLDFWSAHDFLKQFRMDETLLIIETPNAKRVLYARMDEKQDGRYRERIASNVGSNRREAALLAERFERFGFTVKRVKPLTQKWSSDELKRKTGIAQRTNEHIRDAVKLVVDHGGAVIQQT